MYTNKSNYTALRSVSPSRWSCMGFDRYCIIQYSIFMYSIRVLIIIYEAEGATVCSCSVLLSWIRALVFYIDLLALFLLYSPRRTGLRHRGTRRQMSLLIFYKYHLQWMASVCVCVWGGLDDSMIEITAKTTLHWSLSSSLAPVYRMKRLRSGLVSV
jgi:hypothetical protein